MIRPSTHVIISEKITAYAFMDGNGNACVRLVMSSDQGTATLDLPTKEGLKFGRGLSELCAQHPLEEMTMEGSA